MKSAVYAAAALATVASAAPQHLAKRANIDSTILNYALTLEHLEATFYAEGVKNFTEADFTKAGFNQTNFYKNLQEIAFDEASHVTFLTTAIKAAGYSPVAACQYDFGKLTPATFAATASILEGVGVTAYLGAAALITNKAYLTAAGSILTVEARHDAFWRLNEKASPFPQPYDVPLDFDQVYSLAAPFIVSCPSTNANLGVKAFPALTVAADNKMPLVHGETIHFTVANGTALKAPLYIAYPLATGTVFEPATIKDDCIYATIPKGKDGPFGESYAILTTSNSTVTDDNTVAGPAIVEIQSYYLS